MAVIIFIVILFVLIVVHEFGHFFTAKLFKMRVDEFGLGYPPKAKTLFVKGETKYTLNWLPFGGFVKIFGENSEDQKDPRSFINKAWYKQAIVLIAGVFMNLLLAGILISVGFLGGLPTSTSHERFKEYVEDPHVVLQEVVSESPAEKAGLLSGDTILYIQDKDKKEVAFNIVDVDTVRNEISGSEGKELILGIKRGEEEKTIQVVPEKNDNGVFVIGVSMDSVGTLTLPFFKAIKYGFQMSGDMLGEITKAFGNLISGSFKGTADLSSLTGPVGIVGIVGDAYEFGWINLLFLTAMISLNLVVINLIPFPALDGGRLLFVFIEALTRKKIPAKVAGIVNGVGFILLIGLMIFVTYRDIAKLVS